jgi:diaminopropionate ammonia-lyase
MSQHISMIRGEPQTKSLPAMFRPENYARVQAFHQSLADYRPTPLIPLPGLARKLGLGGVYVKDESRRFGLNSFKALGASYAVAKLLEAHPRLAGDEPPVFVSATDGNHGKAVAWAAAQADARAVIFMPRGSRECRARAIREVGGATVEVTALNYDDTVRLADGYARRHGYDLVQDTGFDGYERVPNDIVSGYTTMAAEAVRQLRALGVQKPSHVLLQAGVGSMSGGVLGYLADFYENYPPLTVIAEADEAACVYESVQAGRPVSIGGHPRTIMAGLNCGEPNVHTWPVLRDFASWFARCPDWVAEQGMRQLARPEPGDEPVVSGESGAVGLGLLLALCREGRYAPLRQALALDESASVLLFSTEGDTDPENYRAILNQRPEGASDDGQDEAAV